VGDKDPLVKSGAATEIKLPLKLEYIIKCTVVTRVAEIPIQAAMVKVNDQQLGVTGADGVAPASSVLSDDKITVTAEYENKDGKLKKEVAKAVFKEFKFSDCSFKADISNKIEKIRDVAGSGDLDFEETYSIDQTSPSGEIKLALGSTSKKHEFEIIIKMNTFSLDVPYLNQRSANDSIKTVIGKDPEPAHTHTVTPAVAGDYLCFPSCTTMLLHYWAVNGKTRSDVTQEAYNQWANNNFVVPLNPPFYRIDRLATSIKAATAPIQPDNGIFWLDTSGVDPAKGHIMKQARCTHEWIIRDDLSAAEAAGGVSTKVDFDGPVAPALIWIDKKIWKDTGPKFAIFKEGKDKVEWKEIPDIEWRVVAHGYNIWTIWWAEQKAIEAFKSAGTTVKLKNYVGAPIGTSGNPDIFREPYLGEMRDELAKGQPLVLGTTATDYGHMMVATGCVVDKDGKIKWLIVNDPYGNLASEGSIYDNLDLVSAVGKDGVNHEKDVSDAQELLKVLNYYHGDIDGKCGGDNNDPLVKAIKAFQGAGGDGTIEPGKTTEQRLNNAKRQLLSYSDKEKEKNGFGNGGEANEVGKHVYYDQQIHGSRGNLEIKANGPMYFEKDAPFTKTELAAKLVTGTAKPAPVPAAGPPV
jgi:hypothetical protein